MATECRQDSLDFGTIEGRSVVGAFDGGVISSDAGALLLGATDRAIRLIAVCHLLHRFEHTVTTLVPACGWIALGYEDLNDHDELRPRSGDGCAGRQTESAAQAVRASAGKSTLSRMEHAPEEGVAFAPPRYHKISHDARAIEDLFGTLFLEAHRRPPKRIILDLDATDRRASGRAIFSRLL